MVHISVCDMTLDNSVKRMDRDIFLKFINYRSRLQRVITHSVVWLLYFGLILYYQWTVSLKPNIWPLLKGDIFFFIADILFIYVILFYIDTFLFKKKYFLFAALIITTLVLEVFMYQTAPKLSLVLFDDQRIDYLFDFNPLADITYVLYSMFFPIGLFSILHIARNLILTQAKMTEMASQNLKNELNLLKTQLNQHFLFNTLNNIDSMIYYDPDRASRTVINLSGLLRYALYETNQERVPMFQELDYIRDYLEIFSIRMTPGNNIEFKTDGDYSKITIAPMLFLPFIENAIKFCDRNYPKSIIISFSFKMMRVEFEAFNWKKIQHQPNPAGLGILNIRRRLELLYPDKHTLSIEDDLTNFKVKLIVETGD